MTMASAPSGTGAPVKMRTAWPGPGGRTIENLELEHRVRFDDAIQPIAAQLFPEAAARVADFPLYISLLFQAMQGMGLANATWPNRPDDPTRAQVRALLTRLLRDAFAQAKP